MECSQLLSKLQLTAVDVQDVFLIGSRMYGTGKNDSDYDAVVVTRREQSAPNGVKELQQAPVDAMIMGPATFVKRLCAGGFKELLCIYGPRRCRLQDSGMADKLATQPAVSKDVIVGRAIGDSDREWSRVEKYIKQKDLARAKKTLLCKVRELLLYKQLVERTAGEAESSSEAFEFSFEPANDFHATLQELYFVSGFPEFDAQFGTNYRELVRQIREHR